MPKRKRILSEGKAPEERLNELQKKEVEHKIVHWKKVLLKALKISKRFERQKLARRESTAKEKGDTEDIARIHAEIKALNALKLPAITERYVNKSLLKAKPIASAPGFPSRMVEKTPKEDSGQSQAAEDVIARMFNSKHCKSANHYPLLAIYKILGLESGMGKKPAKQPVKLKHEVAPRQILGVAAKSGSATQSEDGMATDSDSDDSSTEEQDKKDNPSWEGFISKSEDDGKPEKAEKAASDFDSEDLEYFESRVAASSDESCDNDDVPDHPSTASSSSEDEEEEDEAESEPEPGTSNSRPSKIRKLSDAKDRSTPGDSAFLPSLMAGYWSGSESAEDEDPATIKTRKNRMGQQARRALWEKKYGSKANHLKSDSNYKRDHGWDPRKGATDGGKGKGRRREGEDDGPQGGNNDRPSGKTDDGKRHKMSKKQEALSGPLHPSWEAARKAKKEKKGAEFQGKKVVFD